MWEVVASITMAQKSAVVLTTHSMEEAEALSTKMGIMVAGGVFKCFGSSQHIRDKFGSGFVLLIKTRTASDEELDTVQRKYFPGQRLADMEDISVDLQQEMLRAYD